MHKTLRNESPQIPPDIRASSNSWLLQQLNNTIQNRLIQRPKLTVSRDDCLLKKLCPKSSSFATGIVKKMQNHQPLKSHMCLHAKLGLSCRFFVCRPIMHKDAISNDPVCWGHCFAHISLRAHVRAMHQHKTTFFALMATVRISPFAKKRTILWLWCRKRTHTRIVFQPNGL